MGEQVRSEPDPKQVWEWLAEAEDKLEEAVNKYNELIETKEKSDRRDFVREILIRSLRQDVRRYQEDKTLAQDLTSALEIKLKHTLSGVRRLEEALDSKRRENDQLKIRLQAQSILRQSEAVKSRRLLVRVNELLIQLKNESKQKIQAMEEANNREVKPSASDERQEFDHAIATLKTRIKQLESDMQGLEKEKASLSVLVEDQSNALGEWETAYSSLEAELRDAKKTIQDSINARPAASIAPPAVHPERTSSSVRENPAMENEPIQTHSSTTSEPETALGKLLGSVMKIVSKM